MLAILQQYYFVQYTLFNVSEFGMKFIDNTDIIKTISKICMNYLQLSSEKGRHSRYFLDNAKNLRRLTP